jgi:hypothetical protein
VRNDYTFKIIFYTEKDKDIRVLIYFLNDILGFTDLTAIQDVGLTTPEIAAKKQSIVDVLCKDSQGSSTLLGTIYLKNPLLEYIN